MEIIKKLNGDKLSVKLLGKLDTNTAPDLEKSLGDNLAKLKAVDLDLTELVYISSAGLRVVLMVHKALTQAGGTFKILHPTDEVMEVLDMTGFSSFLNIEE